MYDAFHVTNTAIKQQVFQYSGNWVIWNKPRNVTMVHFLVIWPWAWGWSWYGWGAGTNRSWWAWWGSWGMVRASCPAYLLPNQLYIYVGKWWAGGAWSAAWSNPWSNGELSYIWVLSNNTNAWTLVLVSWAAAPTGGWGWNSWSNSTAWAASTIMTSANAILSTRLNFTAVAWVIWQIWTAWAVAGTAAVALAAAFVTWWPWGWSMSAANANAAWGDVTGVTNLVPTIPWWVAWGATWGDWQWWYSDMNAMIFTAWSGSWSGTTTGGACNPSGIWCWGAWSWASSGTSSKWGDGGNGLVVITAV